MTKLKAVGLPGFVIGRNFFIEGLFARIERWTRDDRDVHWRSISKDNILTIYGKDANARILGTELWNTEPGLAANETLRGAWFASVSDAYYRQLATKYRARFAATPYRLSALGYDAVLLTVRIAQDWRIGTPFPAASLTDKGGFAGIDGAFRFGRDGVAERALEVQQIGDGKFTVIDAAAGGFGQ